MSWDDLRGHGVDATSAVHDSRRFGLDVLRVVVRDEEHDGSAVAARIVDLMDHHRPDVAVVRWPARLSSVAGSLSDARLGVTPADTLLYWAGSAATPGPVEGVATLGSAPGLVELLPDAVRETFRDYDNHYRASAVFPAQDVLDGYVEWAARTAAEDPTRCLVVVRHGQIAAFATTSVLNDGSVEVDLAGTVPRFRGEGCYSTLLRGVREQAAASAGGAPVRVLISTQAWNITVQALWADAGLRPVAAVTTAHVTPR